VENHFETYRAGRGQVKPGLSGGGTPMETRETPYQRLIKPASRGGAILYLNTV